MSPASSDTARHREAFTRFIFVGCANTLASYLLYLLLCKAVHHQIAYALAYVAGIATSYLLNAKFTFRERLTRRSALLFPFAYMFQYASCAILLEAFVVVIGISTAVAPLCAIALTTPITYLIARYSFRGGSQG